VESAGILEETSQVSRIRRVGDLRLTLHFEAIEVVGVLFLGRFFDHEAFEGSILVRWITKAWLTEALIAASSESKAHQWFTTGRRLALVRASEQIGLFRLWIVRLGIRLARFSTLIDVHHDEINIGHGHG
jgi:hypothetical protein